MVMVQINTKIKGITPNTVISVRTAPGLPVLDTQTNARTIHAGLGDLVLLRDET
jgi:hypothetical protein